MPIALKAYRLNATSAGIYLLTFAVSFIVSKVGLNLYFNFHTLPALIWPESGVALAFLILYGYRVTLPIFVAQFLAFIVQLGWSTAEISAVISAAFALQTLVALYILERFGFKRELNTSYSAQLFVAVAFLATVIEPALSAAFQFFMHTLSDGLIPYFLRAWMGGIFSLLVFTPFIITWMPGRQFSYSRNEKWQHAVALSVLAGTIYFVFWTTYVTPLGIIIIFFVPAVLMWFSLNMRPHWMALSLFIFAVGGMAGSIIAAPTPTPLSLQLLSDEIYIGLIAALFIIFVAIVEERRNAFAELKSNIGRLDIALEKISAEDRAKTEFIAMLGHELRNPLAPIVSAHEWLQLQPQTPSSIEALESAQENTRMMQRLLDDLLDTARVSQQKLRLQRENVRMQDIIAKAIESTANFLQSRHHKLRISMPAESVWIYGDAIRLRQVVINLLNNAGKYTEAGGNIELSSDVKDNVLTIKVEDNGKGLAKEKLETIFEPFNQIRDESGINTGLGIGLSLSRRLVELHGGKIYAESKGLGQGSAFTVILPIPDQDKVKESEPKKQKTFDAYRSDIMVVDDNLDAARGLRKLLEYQGHNVKAAYSAEEALKQIPEFKPDAIFLDIGLPDMNGYDVAKKLRADGWQGLLVALTGYGQPADQKRALEAGCDVHFIKPISIQDINALLADAKKPLKAV
jgi:signal transduction histidine kinase/ActR/RegA family two-component response regulator